MCRGELKCVTRCRGDGGARLKFMSFARCFEVSSGADVSLGGEFVKFYG